MSSASQVVMLRMVCLMMRLGAQPMTMRRLMARLMSSTKGHEQETGAGGRNLMPWTLIRMGIWTSLASHLLRPDGQHPSKEHEQEAWQA